ncbi:MAG TPA: T9SS type A sorting domain-containing protein [Ignavibacteria bacterium]|nr:T9SS type A sorting domain-containing protein [Ignavibacteria bacterium]
MNKFSIKSKIKNNFINAGISAVIFIMLIFPFQLKADVVGIVNSFYIQIFNETTWLPVTTELPLTMSGYSNVQGYCVTWNSDDLLYYATVQADADDTCRLVTVDPATGICTEIGPMDAQYYSLTYNSDLGQMYCIKNSLRIVNLSDGTVTNLGGGPFSSDIIAYNYSDGFVYSFPSDPTGSTTHQLEKISTQFPFLSANIPVTGDPFDYIRAVVYRGGNNFIAVSAGYFPIPVVPPGAYTINTSGVASLYADPQTFVSGGLGYVDPLLPVELSAFNYFAAGNNITLNWSTSYEINNSGFNIERANSSGNWINIGNVSGHGTTSSAQNYEYTDKNLSSGKYNYRLKQIDFNGNFEYFDLNSEVVIGVPENFELSQNYPNPFNPSTKIEFQLPEDGIVNLSVYDNSGREVVTLVNEFKTAGYYSVNFSVTGSSSLSSGVYFYKLTSDSKSITKKMLLVK